MKGHSWSAIGDGIGNEGGVLRGRALWDKMYRGFSRENMEAMGGVLHFVCEDCDLGATLGLQRVSRRKWPARSMGPDKADNVPAHLQELVLLRCDRDWRVVLLVHES